MIMTSENATAETITDWLEQHPLPKYARRSSDEIEAAIAKNVTHGTELEPHRRSNGAPWAAMNGAGSTASRPM